MSIGIKTNEALSREIRRLTTKLALATEKSKRGEVTESLQADVMRLKPIAARVPELEARALQLELELSLATVRAHARGAQLAEARKNIIESHVASLRSAVEKERAQSSCEKAAAAAAKSEAGFAEARNDLSKLKNEMDDLIEKNSSQVASLSAEVKAARDEATTWKSASEEAGRKLAAALAQVEKATASLDPTPTAGLGSTFSPAPLANGTLLGHPANLTPVKDLASESRSRFTATLPFRSEEIGPIPLDISVEDGAADDGDVERPAERRRKNPRAGSAAGRRAVATNGRSVAKRPRGRPAGKPDPARGKKRAASDGQDDLAADIETETESEGGSGPSVAVAASKVTPDTAATRGSAKKGEDRSSKSRRNSSRGGKKNARRVDANDTAAKESHANSLKGGRGIAEQKTRAVLDSSVKTDAAPVFESDVEPVGPEPPKRLDGRTSRQRKRVSYDYSIGKGADVSFEFGQ
jgi:hypothetical protein